MYHRHAVLAAAMLLIASVSVANAQGAADRRDKEGFYGSIGWGYGSLSVSCSGCSSNNTNSLSGYLALGGTIKPSLRLGLEVDAWQKSEQGFTLDVAYYMASATIYPSVNNDFWVKVNAGYTNATGSGGGSSSSSNGGFAGGLGIGYDWRVAHGNFALIPYLNYAAQLSSSGGEGKANVLQIGIGIGYRH
jgi:outer membrane protein with beta-barrel domain